MKAEEPFIVCDNCGQEAAHIHLVSRTYDIGDDMLIIRDVPVVSCANCGESYLTAETMHAIERIKRNRKSLAVSRPVEVASFS